MLVVSNVPKGKVLVVIGIPELENLLAVSGAPKKKSTVEASAGIFKQSMGARNQVGIGLSYRHAGYIGWRNWVLGIDSWAP